MILFSISCLEYFLDMFKQILELHSFDTSEFCVTLYDFHDTDLYFENETDMDSFLNNYDCAPYTAFKVEENQMTVLYSA